METVGEIGYDARLFTKNIKRDARTIENAARDTGSSLGSQFEKGGGKAEGALQSLGVKLVGAAAGITAVVGAASLVGNALKDLAGLQTARSGFEVLTGSAEKASAVMADIAKYSNNTPFEFPEIAGAAKTLLGFGVAAENVQSNIEQLGDAVAASGGDFSNVSRVFGQIFAAGKINAEDFNQLIDNGIALGPELAKELGVPVKELKDNIEKGKVTFDVFSKALTSATSKGGKYFGATDKLALTLNGRISTLKDTFTGFIGEVVGVDFSTGIVKANGAFDIFSNTVKAVTDFLSGGGISIFKNMLSTIYNLAIQVGTYLAPKLQALSNTVATQLFPILDSLWKNVLQPLIPAIGIALVVAIGATIDALNILVPVFTGFVNFVTENIEFLAPIIGALAGLKAALMLNAAFTAATAAFTTFTTITIPAASAAVKGFGVLLATPIVMPAIVVAAAVASILAVLDAYNTTVDAIKGQEEATNRELQASLDLMQAAKNAKAKGKIDDKEFKRLIGVAGRADGGNVSSNTPYLVGENRDGSINDTTELFVPRSSGSIINSKDLQSSLGQSGGSQSNVNVAVTLSGIMTRSRSDTRAVATDLIESVNEVLRARQLDEIGGGNLRKGAA